MQRIEKIYAVHRSLSMNRRGCTKERLKQVAECSMANLDKILRFMREDLRAPIPLKPQNGLYRYSEGTSYELPGIWFGENELLCLTELAYRLEELQAEFLTGTSLRPFVEKLEFLMESRNASKLRLSRKVRFLSMRMRKIDETIFRSVMDGLFEGKQLQIRHQSREAGSITERFVSPQKMVRYRDNWYLDGYCHTREAVRIFSLSGMLEVRKTKEKFKEVPEKEMEEHLASAYGLFAGKADKTAEILLSGSAASMAENEPWHPREERQVLDGGKLLLHIPYRDSRELLGDILHYGEEAVVVGPPELRGEMIKKLKKMTKKYGPE